MNYKHGFTLIELLVVVLIIGILAAVALPQYNKAVRKAQGAEALAVADALNQAMTAYYLENDSYEGAGPDTLNVQIPSLKTFRFSQVGCSGLEGELTSDFRGFAYANKTRSCVYLVPPVNTTDSWGGLNLCWEKGNFSYFSCFSPNDDKLCKSYFNCTCSNSSCTNCYLNQ